MFSFQDILDAHKAFHDEVEYRRASAEAICATWERDPTKENRSAKIRAQTKVNDFIREEEKRIAQMICSWMFDMESVKIDSSIPPDFLIDIKAAFLMLIKTGRMNSRYCKIPLDWVEIGAVGAVLEDFVVIMRTPHQIGVSSQHMTSIDDIILGFRKYLKMESEKENSYGPRFIFMTHLFNNNSEEELKDKIRACVEAQGSSKRIGIYKEDGVEYYYALQGIYGKIPYDPRAVRILSLEEEFPPFGVHFSRSSIVHSIWNKLETENKRAKGKKIPVGEIARFDRTIHALSCIRYDEEIEKFRIKQEFESIRDRMVNGLLENNRMKYQAGLVIDIKKALTILPPGSVMMNEIGTLLITESIPHECLVTSIETKEDLAIFWNM